MLQKILSVMAILLLCVAVFNPHHAAAEDNEAFVVKDIPVMVQAENPTVARDDAIEQAQIQAFSTLVKRMFPFEKQENVDSLDKAVIFGFVRDFSLKNERHSATEYRAEFTVRFNEQKVRTFFENKGVEVSEVKQTRILVIPILQMGQRLMVWDDPNPWREAWKAADVSTGQDMLSVVVPVGDIMDLRSIPGSEIFSDTSGRADAFRVMLQRYNADELFFALFKSRGAALSPTEGADIVMYRYNQHTDNFEGFSTMAVDGSEGFDKAITTVVDFLGSGWESVLNQKLEAMKATVAVRFPIRTLRDWIVTKEKLSGLDLISALEVLQLNKNFVDLSLEYTGRLEDLDRALNEVDLELVRKTVPVSDGRTPSFVLQTRY